MAVILRCTSCNTSLQVREPAPAQVRCPKCGVSFASQNPAAQPVTARSVPASAPVPAAAPTAQMAAPLPPTAPVASSHASAEPTPENSSSDRGGMLMLLGLLGGLLFLGALSVLGILLFMREDDPAEKKIVQETAQQKGTTESAPLMTPPKIKYFPPPVVWPPKTQSAIDQGIAHLRIQLPELRALASQGDNAAIGKIALAALTMLEAGVSPDDPAIQSALVMIRQTEKRVALGYTLSVCLFFLNRLHESDPLQPEDRAVHRTLALRLLAGQGSEGFWSYQNNPVDVKTENEMLRKLSDNTYKPFRGANITRVDTSQTQFALLALWGSRRLGLPVRPALMITVGNFHKTQNSDGSWGYVPSPGIPSGIFTDSNTCAGLIALAMEKSLREDKEFKAFTANDPPLDPKTTQRREQAFARLAVAMNPPPPKSNTSHGKIIGANAHGDYYFLWCLERVAVIYDLKLINGKDWYAWGSEIILNTQRKDGSWEDGHGDVCDTCFAMLFLTRANLARDLTESIRSRGSD